MTKKFIELDVIYPKNFAKNCITNSIRFEFIPETDHSYSSFIIGYEEENEKELHKFLVDFYAYNITIEEMNTIYSYTKSS